MYTIVKVIVSAIIIGVVSEVSRRFPTYGGIIAALPLVSILSIIWLNVQGETATTLSKFALGVLFGFPATAVLLLTVYFALKQSANLYLALLIGTTCWFLFLMLQQFVIDWFNPKIF